MIRRVSDKLHAIWVLVMQFTAQTVDTRDKKISVACMRDEALFVVEWVAHHLAAGFDRIIVYTNDCSDGTDKLLEAMSRFMPVEHTTIPGRMW